VAGLHVTHHCFGDVASWLASKELNGLDGLDGWHNPTTCASVCFSLSSARAVYEDVQVSNCLPNFGSIDRTLKKRMAQQFENHPQMWQQRVQVTNATTSTTV